MNFLASLTATAERRITLALLLFLCALYFPFAGNYGLWDPWETHYSEVARQMLMRHDYVSLWWPGSPQDRNEFWSKPVLTFWLMAIGMKLAGLENTWDKLGHVQHAFDGEMATRWTAEWAVRIPFILCGIACVWAVWELTRRLAGRRAGLWSAIILATGSQFFYVTRQAMTDMAFVAPIAVALCFGGLAVMLPREETDAELPRRRWGRLSWPKASVFYVLVGMVLVVMLPQLITDLWQPAVAVNLGRHTLRIAFLVEMLPWIACMVFYFACIVRIDRHRIPKGSPSKLASELPREFASALPGELPSVLPSQLPRETASLLPRESASQLPMETASLLPRELASDLPIRASGKDYGLLGAGLGTRRQIYLHIAFLMGGLSTLAKGPAGIALPVLVLLFYLLVRGELARLLPPPRDPKSGRLLDRLPEPLSFVLRFLVRSPLEAGLGTLLFAFIASPWYHGMLIKHGMGFWNEFIGDNYVHRAAGRHGDRGTFDYYILQIGQGMFPWTGFVAAGVLAALGRMRGSDGRTRLRVFAIVWFLILFTVMSLVNTKFHHYIVPALPALAILGGLLLDDLFARPKLGDALALLLAGVPMLALAARDLAMFPARLLWLFCYDYVNAPNGGRPWPTGAEYGSTYEYGSRIAAFGIAACLCTLAFALLALWRSRKSKQATPEDEAGDEDIASLSPVNTWLLALIPLGTVIAAQLWQPRFGDGKPNPLENGWILVAVAGSVFLALLLSKGLTRRKLIGPTLTALAVGAVACAWTAWGLDRLLTDVSPHWSQKHVIAAYYNQRKDETEPLIAWQMYWRGENFYTKNAIYDHRVDQKEKTVFLGDHNAEKMQEYFKNHANRRVFFIVERTRLESLRALLPEASRASLKAVDSSNNKVFLAVAQL